MLSDSRQNSLIGKCLSKLHNSIKEEGLSIAGKDLVEILRDVLSKGVPSRLQAPGFSMSPFIKNGDIVTVTPLPDSSPGIGDVVAFIRPGVERLVVHRVVGKKNGCFVIKGDNAPDTDGLIPGTNILGCVKKVERRGKKIFFGLGVERFLIAFLSRINFLLPIRHSASKLKHFLISMIKH